MTEVHEALRRWAKGPYPFEADVELLIHAFNGQFANSGQAWVQQGDDPGRWWIDVEQMNEDNSGAMSGGETRLCRIAASLLGGPPVDLSDYDGYTVYCPSPVCSLIMAQANLVPAWSATQRTRLQTIADNDTLAVQRGETGTVNLLANDISLSAPIRPDTLDLDPSTAGRQLTRTLAGGTLTAAADGTVTFTGEADFTGKVTFPYSISNGITTATANLVVTVRPKPGDPVVLASWEDGLGGWTAANWQSDPGTLSTGPTGATAGSSALQVASKGAWFGSPSHDPLLNLSPRSSIEFDIKTADVGTSVSVAVRNGSAWTWCQSGWAWVPAGTSETVKMPLDTFGCDASGLTEVHDVLICFNAGTFSIDRLTVS